MRNVYLAIEGMSVLIILILLYANIFEIKQNNKKRNLFTQILILNGIIVMADAISWMPLGWKNKPELLWLLVVITYIVPYFAQAVFSEYLYEHICQKATVKKWPFVMVISCSIMFGVYSLVMCVIGKMFTIDDGKFYAGTFDKYYYLFYLISLLIFLITILAYSGKMGLHDAVAALSYCMIPAVGLILSLNDVGINLSIAFLSIEVLVIYIMLQSEGENQLLFKSNNDELTGLYNRRAYEEDMLNYFENTSKKADLVYASVDVNGLKQANDTLGHVAGDELICATAQCLKSTFGNYGRVYRVGGDEFVAMFFAKEEKLELLKQELEETINQWHGNLVDSISISAGYVTKAEFPAESVSELSKIADKRMYQAKREYYSKRGIDRRGQAAAHKALLNLYTKILKINLTYDTYSIINMDLSEQTSEKGFANTISEWLLDFGRSGQVHKDDIDDYFQRTDLEFLRDYFKQGKTSITINYRRKYTDEYKQVAMDMILADDYSADNQSLFLYVKNIDL